MHQWNAKMRCGGCGRVQMARGLVPDSQVRLGSRVEPPFIACTCGACAWEHVDDSTPVTPDPNATDTKGL